MSMPSPLLRAGRLAACGVLAAACSTDVPVASPTAPAAARAPSVTTVSGEEVVGVSPVLAQLNAQLAASGAPVRIGKAELRHDGARWDGATSTILFAEDRFRGIGIEWVPRDPRRGGRVGVTYAVNVAGQDRPITRDPDGSNVRQVSYAELDAYVEEGMTAWRNRQCSSAPITRNAIAPRTNPDLLDDLFLGRPLGNYVQPADMVQSGWLPNAFFRAIAGGPSGDNIIGVAFTFWFVDGQGQPTDIDGNGKLDTGLSEIFYNTRFRWGATGAPNVVDFYSIIAHETGHALGLGHFGKVFVTRRDAADGVQIADIKYAPKALMNAVYVSGRDEIAGTDNSSFCQLWSYAR
jgi:hypothetical protein